MPSLGITVHTRSGVALTHNRGPGDTNHTLPYIPGSAVRGAMAARYLAQPNCSANDAFFCRAFIEEGVSFPDLYPIGQPNQSAPPDSIAFPAPLSALSCKYWPGFPGRERVEDQEMHGVHDTLIRMAQYQTGQSPEAFSDLATCSQPNCHQPLARFNSFVERYHNGLYRKRETQTRLVVRVGIDRQRRSAADGLLYTIEAIAEDQWFRGAMHYESELEPAFQNLLGSKGEFRVGVGRSRGLGALAYEITPAPKIGLNLKRRLTNVKNTCEDIQDFKPCKNPFYLPLTLVSDCILTDPFLRYCRIIPPEVIARKLDMDPKRLQLLSYAVHHRVVRGWNAVLGLPKSEQLAIGKGSTFLFVYDRPKGFNATFKQHEKAIEALENSGLGLRRGEGFGRLVVAHPFHIPTELAA